MSSANINLGDLYLKISSWFVGHKDFFKKWWVIVILAIDISLMVYIVTNVVLYVLETPHYNQLIAKKSEDFVSQSYRLSEKPKDLEVVKTKAIYTSGKRFDLLAEVKNPNEQWGLSSFNYRFKLDGEETGTSAGFILPSEQKYFLLLNVGQEGKTNIKSVELIISDIKWQKFSNQELLAKVKFGVKEAKLELGEVATPSGSSLGTILEATVENQSLFSFWQVGAPVVLKVQGEPVAVNYYSFRLFESNSSQDITLSWLYDVSLSAEIDIVPEVNILEGSNFVSS